MSKRRTFNLGLLVEKLEAFGLERFINEYRLILCKRTLSPNKMAAALNFDVDQIAIITHPPDNYSRNEKLYEFIEKKASAMNFLESLEKTGNEHVGIIIQFLLAEPPKSRENSGTSDPGQVTVEIHYDTWNYYLRDPVTGLYNVISMCYYYFFDVINKVLIKIGRVDGSDQEVKLVPTDLVDGRGVSGQQGDSTDLRRRPCALCPLYYQKEQREKKENEPEPEFVVRCSCTHIFHKSCIEAHLKAERPFCIECKCSIDLGQWTVLTEEDRLRWHEEFSRLLQQQITAQVTGETDEGLSIVETTTASFLGDIDISTTELDCHLIGGHPWSQNILNTKCLQLKCFPVEKKTCL